jgi:hypothetical protein
MEIFAQVFDGFMQAVDSNPLTYFLIRAIAFMYVFFILFVAVMSLYRAHLEKKLTKAGYILGWPIVAIAGLFDVIANLTVVSIICLDPPRDWLVTSRFRRYVQGGEEKYGFRYRVARGVCKKLLDYFDPRGSHCYQLLDAVTEDETSPDPVTS